MHDKGITELHHDKITLSRNNKETTEVNEGSKLISLKLNEDVTSLLSNRNLENRIQKESQRNYKRNDNVEQAVHRMITEWL